MSIDLTTASPLENASIQYTYPEMNIKNITKESGNVVKFYFQSSIAASTFTFMDSSANSYISGTPAQGTISKGIHSGNTYELTIKHISPTGNNVFYVVFPLINGGQSSIIDKINENATSNIDIYTDETVGIKGLNDIIKASFTDTATSNKIYKYTGSSKDVFVFEKPLKVNISNEITQEHGLWTTATGTIKYITTDSSVQVLEEIECDYSGDSIEEPSINNKDLSTTLSRVGSISIFFAVFALYTAYFYTYLNLGDETLRFTDLLYVLFYVAIPVVMYFFPNSYKNFNFLNINIYKLESFYALLIIPLWELAYRLIALFIYPRIYEVDNFDFDFIRKFITSSLKKDDPLVKGYTQFLLGLLLVIWVLFVCVILVK
jgi:hypothetical protein